MHRRVRQQLQRGLAIDSQRVTHNPNYKVRLEPKKILEAAQAAGR